MREVDFHMWMLRETLQESIHVEFAALSMQGRTLFLFLFLAMISLHGEHAQWKTKI